MACPKQHLASAMHAHVVGWQHVNQRHAPRTHWGVRRADPCKRSPSTLIDPHCAPRPVSIPCSFVGLLLWSNVSVACNGSLMADVVRCSFEMYRVDCNKAAGCMWLQQVRALLAQARPRFRMHPIAICVSVLKLLRRQQG